MGGCASQPVHPSYVAAQEAELERFRGTPRCPGPVPTTEARQPEEAWESPTGDGGDERLLPGCVAYLRLVQQGELIDAGEHDVAICAVEGMYAAAAGSRGGGGVVVVTGDEPEPEPLSTALLRERGLISTVGRATDDAADLFRGTAALVSGTIPLDL